jgi:hypothetical protein
MWDMLAVILKVPVTPQVEVWVVVLRLATQPEALLHHGIHLPQAQQAVADPVLAATTLVLDMVVAEVVWVCLDRAVLAQPHHPPTMAEVAKAAVPIPTGISLVDATAAMLFAEWLATAASLAAAAALVSRALTHWAAVLVPWPTTTTTQ